VNEGMKEERERGMRKRTSRHTPRRISSRINICGGGCGRRFPAKRKERFPRQTPGVGTNNERDIEDKWGESIPKLTGVIRYLHAKIFDGS